MNKQQINNFYQKLQREQGIALISVIIVVALISASISAILAKQNAVFDDTKLNIYHNQALNYLYSATSLADLVLKEDSKNYDGLDEKWSEEVYFPIPGGSISGKITDLTAKLNINNVFVINKGIAKLRTNPNFETCLLKLNTQLEQFPMIDSMLGYITKNKSLLQDSTEINNIEEISSKDYIKIKPYIYAIPELTKININTAKLQIIACLHNDLNEFSAKKIIEERPFKTIKDAKQAISQQLPNLSPKEINAYFDKLIAVKSNFFELQSDISIGSLILTSKTILRRKDDKISTYSRNYHYANN